MSKKTGLMAAIEVAGSLGKLAQKLGISKQAINKWNYNRPPAERIVEIERATGVPREQLRPDLYRREQKKTATPEGTAVLA